jgi:hypothetical protein
LKVQALMVVQERPASRLEISRHPAVHCDLSDRARADYLHSGDHARAAAAVAAIANAPPIRSPDFANSKIREVPD